MKTTSGGLMLAMVFAVSEAVAQAPMEMAVRVPVQVSVAGVPDPGTPQVKDGLFEGTEKFAAGAKQVTDVNLNKDMLGLVGGKDGDMAKKMDFVVVHTYQYENTGMYRKEDVEVFRRRLSDGNWNCFVHVQETDQSTDVCRRVGGDNETNELVVIRAEPKQLTFVHLKARMSFSDLQKMGDMGFAPGGMGTPNTPPPPSQPRKP